ncbi:aminotransferase class V-fold PLP-dependent enzyme [Halomonas llamarensis]|uniref:Aminotransferase class V-fold PLP-dependent enzyme n=1 Tax=Halomonas llamarensis TaxID=2945104 RepID=A0ABT0SV60_9GAMM|nr:aminotransferase class V-fold PLP-dependent enzyme [Halomonas llamarensis]MCL7931718.1 aminotransferase class V-fold PLP-dependent enzyme [Halomonas llamarensis]
MTIATFSEDIQAYEVTLTNGAVVRYVNLDNAATTPPFQSVQSAVDSYMQGYGSVHRGAGVKSHVSTDIYEASRDTIRKFVNAPDNSYVLYTANTTGAMNAAAYFFSFFEGKVAVSDIEHSSSWLPWIKAEGVRSLGSERFKLEDAEEINHLVQAAGSKQVVRYKVNDAFEFDIDDIEKILKNNNIKAFVLTASSNATGYCPNVKAIGELVHKYGALYVVDGCQFIQHHKIDMQEMNIDFLAASGHKFYAPYGGGFLIGPKSFFDSSLPYEIGGGNLPYIDMNGEFYPTKSQLAHDPGTPNTVGAVAMAAAIEEISRIGIERIEAYEYNLAKQMFDALQDNSHVKLLVSEKQLCTILPFNIDGVCPQEVARRLNDDFGIGVRYGSFCVYDVVRRLLNITDDSEIARKVLAGEDNAVPGFVRASVALPNTQEDVDRFVAAINQICVETFSGAEVIEAIK